MARYDAWGQERTKRGTPMDWMDEIASESGLNQADLLFDHPAESADAERFRDFGRGPSGFGVVRTTEQPNSKAVCVEVHSTRPAELAKACGAALLSSFRCLKPEARITTTLFVKRTTKPWATG